ncbi:MAG: replication initiator protein [Microviridae sp.]|nr:MAG: replication initiator protein [Microviridae sp.]
MRAMHEKQLHSASCFITLTYDDRHLPEGGSLSMDDYQRFMKRLRHRFGAGIRFMGCGEYGDETDRPHYHIVLLNCDFPDRKYLKSSNSGLPLYSSLELERLWSENGELLGHCNIGNVDFDSCAYVARYVMKKFKNKEKIVGFIDGVRVEVCPETGVIREPVFMTMSRRPGLAKDWYNRFGPHAYEWDSVVFKGVEVPPPRYYDSLRVGPCINDDLKKRRRRMAALHRADQTLARLRVREVVALAKLSLKGRKL